MNAKNHLEEKIRKSKCAICGFLLSVGPLMVMSKNGSQIRCGRCKEIRCRTFGRNILYENIAEALMFPCSYEKCKKSIPWGQVEEHEEVCPFRTVYCPMSYQGCNNRIIEVAYLQSHFTQAHKNNVQLGSNGSISFKLSINSYVIFLLVVDNLKFFVYLSTSTDDFFIVFSLDPIDKFTKYSIRIRSDKKEDMLVSYLNQEIIQFNERVHCLGCWWEECTLKCHPYSQAHRNPASFDWETISHNFDKRLFGLLGNPKHLIITVDLIADQKRQASEDSTTATSCQCHKNKNELEGTAVDEKQAKIDMPC